MLQGQMKPLELAQRVLKPETIKAAARNPYNLQGWKILDRWAYNSPRQLQALEAQGEVVLLGRLLDQQNAETKALEGLSHLAELSEHEKLTMSEVETELK